MNTTESLKRNIDSAEDLGSVVRTMKTLAAVNIRQYESAAESLHEYKRAIRTGLLMLLRDGVDEADDLRADAALPGAIVFGSDQGMCGQFNEQIASFTANLLREESPEAIPVICVGHRAADSLTGNGVSVARAFGLPGSADSMTSMVHELLPVIDNWRREYRIGRIVVCHNRRESASTWKPHSTRLLPLRRDELRLPTREQDIGQNEKANNIVSRCLPFWTMDTRVLFSRLVRQFLFVSLFRACAESQAGENASRIAAMQSAERSIRDRLQLLKSQHAQIRQTTITEELMDVVTGFEALKDES